MLDTLGILFSSIVMMLVVVRAVRLDRAQPWFQVLKRRAVTPAPETAGRRRRI